MRVLIDVGHPAHIHYFKNAAKYLEKEGWEFLWVVRERDSTIELIESLNTNWVSRGKGAKGMLKKLINIPIIDYKIWKYARKFKPDFFLSMSSFYAAHAATLLGKPHINFDDTEHAKFEHILCKPFSTITLSPYCYYAALSKNQWRFNSFLELFYLHPNYFKPNKEIRKKLNLNPNDKFVILRLISWDANHDVGQHGLSYDDKLNLVHELEKYAKVFISSEEELTNELLPYKLHIHPSELHDVLAEANLYVGEGSTTASEAALLGTPAIYINSLKVGNMDQQATEGLVFKLMKYDDIKSKAVEILLDNDSKQYFKTIKDQLVASKMDPTKFLIWLLKNWPESKNFVKSSTGTISKY